MLRGMEKIGMGQKYSIVAVSRIGITVLALGMAAFAANKEKVVYNFTGGNDGGFPISNAVCDSAGNLYGTASFAGADGSGVVWKISGVGCLPIGGPPLRR